MFPCTALIDVRELPKPLWHMAFGGLAPHDGLRFQHAAIIRAAKSRSEAILVLTAQHGHLTGLIVVGAPLGWRQVDKCLINVDKERRINVEQKDHPLHL